MKMEAFDRQNYRKRYTVIPITTVSGPLSSLQAWKRHTVRMLLYIFI